MKRYLIFMGMDNASMGGGFNDFRGSVNQIDEIEIFALKFKRDQVYYNKTNPTGDYLQERFNWMHAVDTEDNYKIVSEMVGFESFYNENKDSLIIGNKLVKI